jgi:sterol desaturase/sphingolipid hydroxylase (fatty acid hydroxylase superfamily)
VFITPNWHRVHHSSNRPETDSHYGDIFTFWDRIFGTAGPKADIEKMQFGIELFREPGEQTFWEMMKMPFKRL